MTNIALDTNVLIYKHGFDNDAKMAIAAQLLYENPVISAQVISEYLNVMKRISKKNKRELMEMCAEWLENCRIHPITHSTIYRARHLIGKYDFQMFDGIIVASALEAGCDILYSADMQDNLVVEKTLTIVNPFK
jgi:predicted nucleic acid-binding protein